MKKLYVMLVLTMVFILISAQIVNAAILFQDLGTAAPPTTLGSLTVTPFDTVPQAAIPDFTLVTTIPGSPIPGNLTTSISVEKDTVPTTWGTWSHGYTGPVFWTNLNATVTLTLPPNTGAFYFYAEPATWATFTVNATTNTGTTSGNVTVNGNGGANGFAFYATAQGEFISSITVTSTDTLGFAIGEFGAAQATIAIPTMTEWGMIIFIVFAGVGSLYYLRRQRRV